MSEKELREDCWYSDEGERRCLHCGLYAQDLRLIKNAAHGADCPLSQEPDLVVVLRWLSEIALPMARGCIKTLPADKEHYEGELMALQNVQAYVEDELGIRLTDDGWEWLRE